MTTSVWSDLKEAAREQVVYRELLWQMTKRDLLLRYKQTVMGVAWAVFMPLTNTAVFSVIFTRVAPIDIAAYPLFAYVGLIAWNFFASSLRFSLVSLTSNTQLVTKVYFPREVFPFSAVLVSLVDFGISALLLVPLMAYYGVAPSPALVALPAVVLVQVLLTAGCAMLLAMGHLFYRDVKYIFEVVIVVAMFGTSVLYPLDRIDGMLGAVLAWNPLTAIVDAYRDVLLHGQLPSDAGFAAAGVLSAVVFLASWVAFHRAQFKFAERI